MDGRRRKTSIVEIIIHLIASHLTIDEDKSASRINAGEQVPESLRFCRFVNPEQLRELVRITETKVVIVPPGGCLRELIQHDQRECARSRSQGAALRRYATPC